MSASLLLSSASLLATWGDRPLVFTPGVEHVEDLRAALGDG